MFEDFCFTFLFHIKFLVSGSSSYRCYDCQPCSRSDPSNENQAICAGSCVKSEIDDSKLTLI
jgi:hypothetical protein